MASPTSRPETIVLIHGLWMTALSWEHWVDRYERAGHRVIARSWPGMEVDIETLRRDPSAIDHLGIEEIVDHYDAIIRELDEPPIIMGHSFGGAFTEILLDRGLGAAGVAIDAAAVKGILALPFSELRSGFPVLRNPANYDRAVALTPDEFHYAFGNTLSDEESRAVYERYAVPGPGRVLFQGALANFNPHAATKVDFHNADRAPLLLIAGGDDHGPGGDRPTAAGRYAGSDAITEYQGVPRAIALHARRTGLGRGRRLRAGVGGRERANRAACLNDVFPRTTLPKRNPMNITRTDRTHRWRTALLAAAVAVVAFAPLGPSVLAKEKGTGAPSKPIIVLVHGAWAGPAGWDEVVAKLQKDGFRTATPALDLQTTSADVANVQTVLDALPGDKILVGHSYGGSVISQAAAGRSDVLGLVYTAAFVPDQGETLIGLGVGYQPPAALQPGHLTFLGAPFASPSLIAPEFFRDDFAADLNPKLAAQLASQRDRRALGSSSSRRDPSPGTRSRRGMRCRGSTGWWIPLCNARWPLASERRRSSLTMRATRAGSPTTPLGW